MATTSTKSKFARAKTATVDYVDAVESKTQSAYSSVNERIAASGITIKDVACLLFAVGYGYTSTYICMWLMLPFMSFWIAAVIAIIFSLITGHYANLWFQESGYSHCVNTVAKVGGMFGGLFARRAAA